MAESYRLASAGGDVKVWDMPGNVLWKTLDCHSQAVSSLCWSPVQSALATAAADKVVVTLFQDPKDKTIEAATGEGHSCVAFSSTSRFLLMGGKSKAISVWDMKTQSSKKTFLGHTDDVTCLTFNWNDQMCASGSINGNILLHNTVSSQSMEPLWLPKTQAIRAVQFSNFRKSILGAVSDDGTLNLWDSNTRKVLASFVGEHRAPATGLSFSPTNELLFTSVGLDKKLIFYDVQAKKPLKIVTTESPLTSVALCNDGLSVAVGTTKGKIITYDLRSGSSPMSSSTAHKTSVQCLAFQSPSSANAKGSSNALSSSITRPAVARPPARRLPTPQVAAVPSNSAPPGADAEHQTHRTHTQQNGVAEDDIFSPLREARTPAASSVTAERDQLRPGLDRGPESRPSDGVFSPLSSDTSSLHVRHHPVGAPSGLNPARRPNAETQPDIPDILGASLDPEGAQGKAGLGRSVPAEEKRRTTGSLSSEEGGGERRRPSDTPPSALSRSPGIRIRRGSVGGVRSANGSPDVSPLLARKARIGSQGASDTPQSTSQVSPETGGRTVMPASMETVTGATGGASGGASAEAAGLAPFQVQFIKNMIEDSLEEFKFSIHRDLVNVQVEMLRQFQIQQNELKALMEKYSMNEALVQEIQRLKEENNRLKTKY